MKLCDYNVLVYCHRDTGHHLNFARLVAGAFLKLEVNVTVALTERAQRSDELRSLAAASGSARIVTAPPSRGASEAVRCLRETIGRGHWSRVAIPSGDGLLQLLTVAELVGIRVLPEDLPIEVLILRGGIAYPGGAVVSAKRRVSWELQRRSRVAVRHHLDPVAFDWISSKHGVSRNPWSLMPDPVESSVSVEMRAARAALNIDPDAFVFGCVGMLDERKGIDLLLGAFEKARLPKDTVLLLAGSCSEPVRDMVSRMMSSAELRQRMRVVDQWVSDEMMMTALSAMNVVVAPYPHHVGSASIVLRAMAAGKPVLGSSTPWIAQHLEGWGAGWTTNPEEEEEFSADLERCLSRAVDWLPDPNIGQLLAYNSPENFQAHWARGAALEIGRPEALPVVARPISRGRK